MSFLTTDNNKIPKEVIDAETPIDELINNGVISRKITREAELDGQLKSSDIIVPKAQSR